MLRAQEMIIFDAVEWTFQPIDERQKRKFLTRIEFRNAVTSVDENYREPKQPRRLGQIRRHLKINICEMVMTILRLLLSARILYC